jgi:hypothetical protein
MIDIMAIKLKVIEASCGITALSELELLHRLEELYLEGISEGVRIAKEKLHHRGEVMKPPGSAAEGPEVGHLNMPQRHGSGAEPQGMEAQATQPSAAPTRASDSIGEARK